MQDKETVVNRDRQWQSVLSNLKWTEKRVYLHGGCCGKISETIQDKNMMLLQRKESFVCELSGRVHMSGQLGVQQGTGGGHAAAGKAPSLSAHWRRRQASTAKLCHIEF